MNSNPIQLPLRTVAEWSFLVQTNYPNPFLDVALDVRFTAPDGQTCLMPAFYAGDQTWKVRFNPNREGVWSYQVLSRPQIPEWTSAGRFKVTANPSNGFLRSVPGKYWGYEYESGEPAFLLGDTVYNLFAMDYCGGDVEAFLRRRARQGFNLLRVRVPVSPFHPPDGYSAWQTRRTWPWGGSEQAPRFDCFNLEYFETVDKVVRLAESLGIGLEMIMEGWGFEFPFNSRQIFVPEWEELWMRYLIARYDAYSCLYFWTPLNEYEYYPNGDWHYKLVADRWALRIARWIKSTAQHGHIVSVHNGPREPAFARRFAADPGAVDAVMFQHWGTTSESDAWLAAGIEEQIAVSFKDWQGTSVFAEFGYERNPDFQLLIPHHEFCDPEHTRRGAWRGAFCGMGVIHGFENTWGPWMRLDEDQPGLEALLHLKRFFTDIVPFWKMRPDPALIQPADYADGYRPDGMVSTDHDCIAIYFPAGGSASLNLPTQGEYLAHWFDPRTGTLQPNFAFTGDGSESVTAPHGQDTQGHPFDFVLVLRRQA